MARTKGQLISPIGIVTVTGLNVTGIATANTFVGQLNSSGVSTIANLQSTNVNVTGITTLSNVSERINNIGNTGTATTINLNNGTFVTATLTGNCTFTFTNPTPGASSFSLFLTNDGTAGRSIVWPASVKWPNNSVPLRTTAANATDVYTFFTLNSGTDWYGNLSLYNYT